MPVPKLTPADAKIYSLPRGALERQPCVLTRPVRVIIGSGRPPIAVAPVSGSDSVTVRLTVFASCGSTTIV